jgi:hypothetical protein
MRLNKFAGTKWVSLAALGVCALGATAANAAYTPPVFDPIPNIPVAGFPEFTSAVDGTVFLTYSQGKVTGLEIQVSQASSTGTFYLNANSAYSVSSETYSFTALLNTSLSLTSGSVSITGKIPSLTSQTNLYGATLTAAAVSLNSNFGLGFETTKATGWASQYQKGNESTWLYDFSNVSLSGLAKNDDNMSDWIKTLEKDGQNAKLTFNAYQITTVPLPAAGWLLLTGLGTLVGRARRRLALA